MVPTLILFALLLGSLIYMILVDPHDNQLTPERKLELAVKLQAHRKAKRLRRMKK